MVIGIIGQGFVGSAIFSKFSKYFKVLTYDLEPNLCNSNLSQIKNECQVVFTCLPTPMKKNGDCDISIVESVIKDLNDVKKLIVVNKSTVVPGTTEFLNNKYQNIQIVFNPEFLTERNAKKDFENQNRIILGGPRPATTVVKNLYSKAFPEIPIIKTGSKHAEMVKYFINSFLATKVSFANEIFQICDRLGLDYDKVVEYSLYDKRIGKSHLGVPGHDGDFGFGGHCFPKDLSALINLSNNLNTVNNVLSSAKETNNILRKNRDWEKMVGRAVSFTNKTKS